MIGTRVFDAMGGKVGNVDDLVLSDEGAAAGMIVDVGGYMGIGSHTVAHTVDAAEILRNEGTENLRADPGLTLVMVLEDPPEGWEGETGRIDAALLARHLPPESRDWPHLPYRPVPMTDAATRALRAMVVPARHIDSEIFELD